MSGKFGNLIDGRARLTAGWPGFVPGTLVLAYAWVQQCNMCQKKVASFDR